MVVNDKQADIAILRTQGLSARRVKRIFMVQGTLIGLIGALFGAILGVLLALNIGAIMEGIEKIFNIELLPQDLFYASSKFPSVVDANQVIGISIAAFILAMLATIYPASRAAKVQPAESLRYE
jgi:lipoprotein-releasing system permease protein